MCQEIVLQELMELKAVDAASNSNNIYAFLA